MNIYWLLNWNKYDIWPSKEIILAELFTFCPTMLLELLTEKYIVFQKSTFLEFIKNAFLEAFLKFSRTWIFGIFLPFFIVVMDYLMDFATEFLWNFQNCIPLEFKEITFAFSRNFVHPTWITENLDRYKKTFCC